MASDWFRKKSWSPADQEDFQRRLARARQANRPQYAIIQGNTLMEQGAKYYPWALALFDMAIDRYPDSVFLVQALTGKATCLLGLGDIEGALTYYYRAAEQMRVVPNLTWAWLDFAWLVACRGISDRYEMALSLLDEFGHREEAFPVFPVVTFRLSGSRALILSARGLHDTAAEAARAALAAADKNTSELRYHRSIGVVGTKYRDIRARLEEIASPARSPKLMEGMFARLFGRKDPPPQ